MWSDCDEPFGHIGYKGSLTLAMKGGSTREAMLYHQHKIGIHAYLARVEEGSDSML